MPCVFTHRERGKIFSAVKHHKIQNIYADALIKIRISLFRFKRLCVHFCPIKDNSFPVIRCFGILHLNIDVSVFGA